MVSHGLPLDEAEFFSLLLEGILYGFSLLMFGGTVWVLFLRRSTHRVNRKMFTVSFLLLVFSTGHIVIHTIRVMYGLIRFRNTYREGPVAYFSDVSQWTFTAKNHVYTAQTLVGDGVILYRCYTVWQSKLVMILPVLLWLSAGMTGFVATTTAQHVKQNGVFGGSLARWITSFWVTALAANLLTTILLLSRIWYIDHKSKKLHGYRNSQLGPMLHILIDAGVIYTFTLIAALVCFVMKSNLQFVLLDSVTPIISITFYMVIIRVGLTCRVNQSTTLSFGNTSMGNSFTTDQNHRMQVHITTLTESKIENGRLSLAPTQDPVLGNKKRPMEIKFKDVETAG